MCLNLGHIKAMLLLDEKDSPVGLFCRIVAHPVKLFWALNYISDYRFNYVTHKNPVGFPPGFTGVDGLV